MNLTIYHNPSCSKSRATLAILEDHGYKPTVVEYLSNPPSLAELETLLSLLGKEPIEIVRTKQEEFAQAGLDKPEVSRSELLNAITQWPVLLERPIVVKGKHAVIGRPPENVLALIVDE